MGRSGKQGEWDAGRGICPGAQKRGQNASAWPVENLCPLKFVNLSCVRLTCALHRGSCDTFVKFVTCSCRECSFFYQKMNCFFLLNHVILLLNDLPIFYELQYYFIHVHPSSLACCNQTNR